MDSPFHGEHDNIHIYKNRFVSCGHLILICMVENTVYHCSFQLKKLCYCQHGRVLGKRYTCFMVMNHHRSLFQLLVMIDC